MHRRTSLPLATLTGAALIAGLLIAPTASPLTQAEASDGTVFIGPSYPNQDNCRTLVQEGGVTLGTFGVVPQQWNSVVGLPVARSGNPAAQRIVIPEFDQIPSMPAVNALLRQCGLLAADAPDFALVQQTLPAVWGSPSQRLGGEATLDASIVYAALPPNTDVVIANVNQEDGGWYGFFVNAAQACGIEFETAPLPSNTAATVPTMSKGPDFPAGGCIITASWGGNEQVAFTDAGELVNSQAASVVLQRLAELGVLTFISAGDEGAGGCLSGGDPISITNVVLATPDSTTTIGTEGNTRTFFTGTATFTIDLDDGVSFPFSVNDEILINRLTGPPGIKELSGVFEVTAINTDDSTFTIEQGLSERFEITPSEASGSATLYTETNFGWTEDPVYDADEDIKFAVQNGTKMPQFPASHPDVVAVGGTQWLPQSETTRLGLNIAYEPGRPYQEFVWKDSSQNSNCANAPDAFVLGQEGTGGGESGQFDMPSYQRAAAQASYGDVSGRKRMLPDIAALAGWPMYGIAEPDPRTNPPEDTSPTAADFCPESIFPCAATEFPWNQESGTSAATPLAAVGFANVNAALTARGFAPITKGGSNDIHSIIYNPANSSAIRDVPEFRGAVRSGDNNLFGSFNEVSMGYSALNGFDMATGMGVPNFTALANLLIARKTPAPPGPGPAPAPQPEPVPQPAPAPAPQPAPAPAPQPAPVQVPDPVADIVTNPGAVTAGAVNSLTPAQVAAIPVATFRQLPPRAFRGLTPDQVRAMSTDQVSVIRPARARAIRPAVLRSFRPQQVKTLRPKSVRALRPAQVRLLRPKQMSALSNRQVRALRPKQIKRLRPAQTRALTPRQQTIIDRKRR